MILRVILYWLLTMAIMFLVLLIIGSTKGSFIGDMVILLAIAQSFTLALLVALLRKK
ncbi:hypothetical protein O0555_18825 [Brevibacillus laterosporus]|uniref:hypothetical protein n=1 Tax=Brevibacillus laterosporus TaxID=1465 RepID=UPI0018CF41D4|nr:hypothetical protein [Brevibacillus laterosporus]MCR8939371.1 hypothetical protein [Brevibacillus laterosporus]MCZ0842011.1 hypothetical protein [Brevibacillus laterosporus]MCZ0847598.1 hypothetical protein [Brevibacillus laterosporus]MED1910786.1 hypothetical protein [Brevibacillus laterosporus]